MSANDGGPAIRVERAEIPKPRIPRGYVSIPLDPADGESGLVAGERADFSLRVVDDTGTAYAARYRGARVVSVDLGKASFDVGPEVVVTWERI